jgi:hypothetical protein
MPHNGKPAPVLLALALWLLWTAATWLLEGRLLTLQRPEAVEARVLYAVVANMVIGIVGSGMLLRWLIRGRRMRPERVGFASSPRRIIAVAAGTLLGFGAYVAQGAPTLEPVILLNGFAQVFVVSTAEVLVCWSLIGVALERSLAPRAGRWGSVGAAAGAAAFFGLYHYAHSPPFNTHTMVSILTTVGLITGVFFFVSRDVYGTIVFHNFLGLFGVLRALDEGGRLAAYTTIELPLIVGALLSLGLLVMIHLLWLRGNDPDPRVIE